jgi:hypothetical protein
MLIETMPEILGRCQSVREGFAPPARIAYQTRRHAGMRGRDGDPKRAHIGRAEPAGA